MNILFIGDVVGRPGRKMVKRHLQDLKSKYKIDYVIANYENMAHGFGITKKIFKEMKNAGIDIFTGGNHTFDKKKEAVELLENGDILRPLNYFDAPGRWYYEDENIVVISVMGVYGMPYGKNPFIELKQNIENFKDKFVFIDFHAEATAEKRAMFFLLKESAGAIIGTHTHIGTDDLEIKEGCVYLSDIGLSGCRDNVIGMEINAPINTLLSGIKQNYDVPNDCDALLQALVIECETNKAKRAFKIKIDNNGCRVTQEAGNLN
ncbi:MAG: YmdB family metallophosphoesterase [Epsilonproteobacteria bacterium]|nr:YmdB family metallophosphoesterase [Campylobacterota bacterium]